MLEESLSRRQQHGEFDELSSIFATQHPRLYKTMHKKAVHSDAALSRYGGLAENIRDAENFLIIF